MARLQLSSESMKPIEAWDSDIVEEFDEEKMDVLVVNRRPMGSIGPIVKSGRIREFLAQVSRERIGFEVRAGLRDLRLKSRELEEDIIRLATSFLDQFKRKEVRLRLEVTKTQSCPKFHYDNVNVRLVTTYSGPTTEFKYAGEPEIHSAPLYSLVFLKGRRHPTYRNTVLHRSPKVGIGERRLCVAIDF